MRSKEEAHDYRYFPEPDLPPLHVPDALIDDEAQALPELPRAKAAALHEPVRAAGVRREDPRAPSARWRTSSRRCAQHYKDCEEARPTGSRASCCGC